jgi:hypothetical protein
VLLAVVVGLALACSAIGVAWFVIGAFVLAGAGLAALRLSGLDEFGLFLGSGELAKVDYSLTSKAQGFGGSDVAVDAEQPWEWKALVGSPTELPAPPSQDLDR